MAWSVFPAFSPLSRRENSQEKVNCQFTLTLDMLICAVVLSCSLSLLITMSSATRLPVVVERKRRVIWQREEGFIPKLAHILHMFQAVDPGPCHTYFSQHNANNTHSQSFIWLFSSFTDDALTPWETIPILDGSLPRNLKPCSQSPIILSSGACARSHLASGWLTVHDH